MRGYALYGGVVLLFLAPALLMRLDQSPELPVQLRGARLAADGSATLSDGSMSIHFVRIEGGPRLRPGDLRVQRYLSSLAADTRMEWWGTLPDGAAVRDHGYVRNVRVSPPDAFRSLILSLVGIAFALFAIVLAQAARDERGLYAAAAFAGLSWIMPSFVVARTARLIDLPAFTIALHVVYSIFPAILALYFFFRFLSIFPTVLTTRFSRVVRVLLLIVTTAAAAATSIQNMPGVLEHLPMGVQVGTRGWPGTFRTLAQLIFAVGAIGVIVQQVRNVRRTTLSPFEVYAAQVLGRAIAICVGVPLGIVALQAAATISGVGRIVPPTLAAASMLTLLGIPAVILWAILGNRRSSVRILARRALLFGASRTALRTASLMPLAAVVLVLIVEREKSVAAVVAAYPILFVGAVLTSLLGLRFSDSLRVRIERLFGRSSVEHADLIPQLTHRFRSSSSESEIVAAAVSQLDQMLPLEEACIFLSDEEGSFRSQSEAGPTFGASGIVSIVEQTHEPIDVFELLRDTRRELPVEEREWLAEHEIAYIFPMITGGGSVTGFLAVAEKRSELPFEDNERALLASVADATAIALENQILRTPGAFSHRTPLQDPPGEAIATSDASVCTACGLVMPPGSETRCPEDRAVLVPLPMPRLLSGKYRLERRIGEGGMGVVYLARDLSLGRHVAIKALPRLSSEAAARLRREARATAGIAHPSIATIYAVETWRGQPIVVLEYVSGGTWDRMIDDEPRPLAEVISTGVAVASALDAAHGLGVLHRDIKPSNIGFTGSGDVRVLDFGLAKFLDASHVQMGKGRENYPGAGDNLSLTRSDTVVGTPAYIAPEAALGAPAAPSFDLWSLAITLYEALTSTNPNAAATSGGTLNRILESNIPDVREYRPAVPDALADLLANALSRDIMRRPQTAAAFAAALRSIERDGGADLAQA